MESNIYNSIINSTISQTLSVNPDTIHDHYFYTSQNFGINYVTLSFDQDFVSILPQYVHICNPEYLVMKLYNPCELDTIKGLLGDMRISLTILNQEIITVPLSFIWSLNTPQNVNNNIYLSLPFNFLYGDLSLISLNDPNNIKIKIHGNSLQNYVSNFNLQCTIKMYPPNSTNYYADMSNNLIQIIDTKNPNSVSDLRTQYEFNAFQGNIKGFFIESRNIALDLNELQFFINSNLNRFYDEFLIKTKTIKINDNLIYFPFNVDKTFEGRKYDSYEGTIFLPTNSNNLLKLHFSNPTNSVKVYVLKGVIFRRNNSIHNQSNTIYHFSSPYGHTGATNYGHIGATNYGLTGATNYGHTGATNYGITGPSTSGHTGPTNYENPIPEGQIINHPIDPERNTCSILHEEIIALQRYMTCSLCFSNFNEIALKQWLRHRTGNRRSCPSCREPWTNYNIYINRPLIQELICD
jgi:hypothetical protein